MRYKIVETPFGIRILKIISETLQESVFEDNPDYLQWLAEGNTPEPPDPPPPPDDRPTLEERIVAAETLINLILDEEAE